MGAGARLAEERDRWPDHWRVADLEQEEEHLLDLLAPTEELRAAVPGRRTSDIDGDEQVLIGVTDRRVIVIGRRTADTSADVTVADATSCASKIERASLMRFPGGQLELDVDQEAMARLWASVDEVSQRTPATPAATPAAAATTSAAPPEPVAWEPLELAVSAAAGAEERGDGAAVGLAPRRLHHGADEGADRLVLAGRELVPGAGVGHDGRRPPGLPAPTRPSPRSPWQRRSPRHRRHRSRPAPPAPAWPGSPSADRRSPAWSARRGRRPRSPARSPAPRTPPSRGPAPGLRRRRPRRPPARSHPDPARPPRRWPRPRPVPRWRRRGATGGRPAASAASDRTASIHASSGTSGTRSGSRKYR